MKPQERNDFGKYLPCNERKGTVHNGRMIMSCGGFEIFLDDCNGCNGKPKTRLTMKQLLTQKGIELNQILRKKGETMTLLTHDEMVAKLEMITKTQHNGYLSRNRVIAIVIIITATVIVVKTLIRM